MLLSSIWTTVGLNVFASSGVIWAYEQIIILSPTCAFLAAAPFRQKSLFPLFPAIMYVWNVVEEQYEDGTKILLEYDLNNNIVSEIWNKNNEVLYCEKHQYDFNEKGFLEKSYFAQFNGKATNSNWQLIEEYDEDGNLISVKKDYEGDGNIDFVEEYDPVLASRTKTIYDSKGKIINVQHYEYDFDGKLISVQYDKDGDGTIEYKKKYQ